MSEKQKAETTVEPTKDGYVVTSKFPSGLVIKSLGIDYDPKNQQAYFDRVSEALKGAK